MAQLQAKGLSPSQLELLKLQLAAMVPQLSREQIYEVADMFYDAARARRRSAFDEDRSWDIRI